MVYYFDSMLISENVTFIGEYEVSIDAKNRIMIPSVWKEAIGNRIFISEGFEGALEIRPRDFFVSYIKKIDSSDSFSKAARIMKRKILGSSREISLDKWFRFVIPSTFCANKNYKNSLILRGNGKFIEVWNKGDYEKWSNLDENSIEKAAEELFANEKTKIEEE